MTSIRILIADDHPVVREGVAAIISNQDGFEVVGKATDGEQAVALWQKHLPDLGLFDLRMPKMDAVVAINAIRSSHAEAKIVILTTYDGDENIFRALRAGAKGYMLKDATMEEIIECVRAVHAGRAFIPPRIAETLALRIHQQALSVRETELLALVVQGMANKEIARHTNISLATVKFHLNNIFSKLGVRTRSEAAAVARRRGLVQQ
jgi:two-component system, NarL family, response regulator